jgi:hypothetical protein
MITAYLYRFRAKEIEARTVEGVMCLGNDLGDQHSTFGMGQECFFSPACPHGLWTPPSLLFNECQRLYPGNYALRTWNWPQTSIHYLHWSHVEPYLLALMLLHGVVINWVPEGLYDTLRHRLRIRLTYIARSYFRNCTQTLSYALVAYLIKWA